MTGILRTPWLLALVAAAITVGCDKAQLLAPTASTITVSAPTRTLALGGTTEITAMVLEQAGTPVQNGTTVRFSTNLGTVDPVEAQTRNGIATTVFSAGSASGVAQVRATSGAAGSSTGTGTGTGGTTTTNVVEIQVGAAAATAVQVTASPSSVLPTGGTVTVIASATDTNGNRLTGVPVTFSTTTGTLSSSTAITDANGEARVQLTTNQAATITARVGNQTGTAAVTQATATSVTLATAPNPSVAGNPVTLTVTPAAGTTPNVTINWGDGSTSTLGTVAAARGVTHIYSSPGIYTITADAIGNGDSFSTATTQTVTARPGPTLTASASTGTTATTFVFTVTPAAGTSPSNVVVDFGDGTSTELGAITSATTVTKRYSSTGAFTVRATQTEAAGSSSSVVVVTVTSP